MCFKVECKQCGEYSWSGCGKHVASAYNSIEKGKHRTSKSWPGVAMASETSSAAAPASSKESLMTDEEDIEKLG